MCENELISAENVDFSGVRQTFTLSSGTTFASPAFTIVNDDLSEVSESFTASISTSARGVTVSRQSAEVIINDNDSMFFHHTIPCMLLPFMLCCVYITQCLYKAFLTKAQDSSHTSFKRILIIYMTT